MREIIFIPTLLLMFSSGILSLGILWLFEKRSGSPGENRFLFNWFLGFFSFSMMHIPTILINFIPESSYELVTGLYLFSFFMMVLAIFFWIRGVLLLFQPPLFWRNVFPWLWIGFALLFLWGTVFLVEGTMPSVLIAFILFVSFPFDALLTILFFIFFIRYRAPRVEKLAPFLLAISWFGIFSLDFLIIRALLNLPFNFWVVHLVSFTGWYIGRAIFFIIILIALILFGHTSFVRLVQIFPETVRGRGGRFRVCAKGAIREVRITVSEELLSRWGVRDEAASPIPPKELIETMGVFWIGGLLETGEELKDYEFTVRDFKKDDSLMSLEDALNMLQVKSKWAHAIHSPPPT